MALSNYLNNFTFGRGFNVLADRKVQHIVPALVERILTRDNKKKALLWSVGQLGSVSGDAFVKVAYDPPYPNGIGKMQRGRVRILPLNPAFCLTPDTEVLTRRGWLTYDQLTIDDEVLSIDPETDENTWTSVEDVNVFDWNGPMANWENERFSVMSTPDHRWLYESGRGKKSVKQTRELHSATNGGAKLLVAGGTPMGFSDIPKWDDDVVEAVAWFVTEGHWHSGTGVPLFTQDERINPEYAARIDRISKKFGGSRYTYEGKADQWYVRDLKESLFDIVGSDKRITPEFLCSLTYSQARLLYETLLDGDGHRGATTTWSQSHEGRVADFQMLTMMLGLRTQAHWRQRDIGKPCCDVTIYKNRSVYLSKLERSEVHYSGKVWCPTTGNGMWVARRNGITFNTGNCFPEWAPHDMERLLRFKLKYRFWATAPEGTRQVYTYTEIITEEVIEEYINDQLISQRENPLGEIPIVHIANKPAASSPWGLSDIQDILPLNRAYNETATEIIDIINYYTAPVTIVTGHKASNMERGANKLWGITNDKAKVYNLEGGAEGLPEALNFLELLEKSMHKMTGVPVNALGEEQEISNTSGVALHIQFFPLMMAYSLKTTQYEDGWKEILRLSLRTLFMAEPDTLIYDPNTRGILEDPEVQPEVLDPDDYVNYDLEIRWPPPFPTDLVVALNEIMMKMQLGLESKVGALLELGEEYPDEKRQELFEQRMLEAKMEGAEQILKANIAAAIMDLTGTIPEGMGEPVPPPPTATPNAEGQTAQPVQMPKAPALGGLGDLNNIVGKMGGDMLNEMVTQAYGTKIPQARQIDKNDNDD